MKKIKNILIAIILGSLGFLNCNAKQPRKESLNTNLVYDRDSDINNNVINSKMSSIEINVEKDIEWYVITANDITLNADGFIEECKVNDFFNEKGTANILFPAIINKDSIRGIIDSESGDEEAITVFSNRGITSIDFSKCTALKYIGSEAFSYNNITSIIFNKSIEKIGRGAFHDNNLKNINFEGCTSLREIGKGAFILNSIEQISIKDCKSLKSIGVFAFYNNPITEFFLPSNMLWYKGNDNKLLNNNVVTDMESSYISDIQ